MNHFARAALLVGFVVVGRCWSADTVAPVSADKAPPTKASAADVGVAGPDQAFDPAAIGIECTLQGEYLGADGDTRVGVQVVARGDRKFHALVLTGGLPGDGWDGGPTPYLESAPLAEERAEFRSMADDGTTATLDPAGLTLRRGGRTLMLRRVVRRSPTLGVQPPAGAVVLFDAGRTGTEAFEERKEIEGRTQPSMYQGFMLGGAVSKRSFRDCSLHVEFMTGWEPKNIPWRRADGGVYLMSRYEVAVGDSFGFDFDFRGKQANLHPRVCGSVFTYPVTVPNSCLPPLVWQTFDIDFTAPRFGPDGRKTADAVVSVRLNGHRTVDGLAVPRPTPHGFVKEPEAASGPIWVEGFGRRVLYRSIWVVERP